MDVGAALKGICEHRLGTHSRLCEKVAPDCGERSACPVDDVEVRKKQSLNVTDYGKGIHKGVECDNIVQWDVDEIKTCSMAPFEQS